MKKVLIICLLMLLLIVNVFAVSDYMIRSAIKKALLSYFGDHSNSNISTSELKDLVSAYLSTPDGQEVDLSLVGNSTGKILNDIYIEADSLPITIPICTDGTQVGECSQTNFGKYCRGGNLIEKASCKNIICGDNVCSSDESCSNCQKDCGNCTPICGDSNCSQPQENCSNCQQDCGNCTPICGDSQCSQDENCTNCPSDCGTCPSNCGDGSCTVEENCSNCQQDCGTCPFSRPSGIYVLDSNKGTNRDRNIRNYSFVSGYTWRNSWSSFETAKGVYNFSKIDDIISKIPAGQKLTILLGGSASLEPAYIALEPRVIKWWDSDRSVYRAVPWDPYLQERFNAFVSALANHQVGGIPLKDHPTLSNIDLGIAGLGHIREQGFEISSFENYSRENFIEAINNSLHEVTDQFPDKFVYIGIWKVYDYANNPELWEYTREMIINEFDGVKNPHVGFFMENLAASKNLITNETTGYPSIEFAAPLYLSRNDTYIMFQALQGWNTPFSNPEKTNNTVPSDGIRYGYDTYKCTYFELYISDIDDPNYWPSFEEWRIILDNE